MVQPRDLAAYCDNLLNSSAFKDYCPNGMQVEGTREIKRLATGVTANLSLLEAAAEWGADAVLVHHGYFWKDESAPLTGMKGARIRTLYSHDMSLFAYHLPLDAHPSLGNNAQLAQRLEFDAPFSADDAGLLWQAELATPRNAAEMSQRIANALDREPLLISGGDHAIRRIGWCTGGAQGFIDQAADAGLDAFLSGEVSEHTVHIARERGIHYFAAGHHATERYGVQALAAELGREFSIESRFFEIDNPV